MKQMTSDDQARYERALANLKHKSAAIRNFAKLVIRTLEAKYAD